MITTGSPLQNSLPEAGRTPRRQAPLCVQNKKSLTLVLIAGASAGLYLSGAARAFAYVGRFNPVMPIIFVLAVLGLMSLWIFVSRRLIARRGLVPGDIFARSSLAFLAFLALLPASLEFLALQPSAARVLTTLALVTLSFIASLILLFSAHAAKVLEFVEKRASSFLLIAGVGYGLLMFSLSMVGYRNGTQPDFNPDSAYYNQVFWNTTQGRFFQGSLWQARDYRPPLRNHFALHNAPALLLLVPLYALRPSYGMLMVFKNLAIVLCIVPLFLLARRKADAVSGLIVACAFLFYPTVVYKSLGAFHEILLAGFPLLLAFYFLEVGRFWPFLVSCVFAQWAREDVALTTAIFGIYAWIRGRNWPWVVTPLALSLSWYFFSVKLLMPAISPSSGQRVLALFAPFGSSYGEVLRNLWQHPGPVLSTLFTPSNLTYLLKLCEPVGLLSLASPINLFLIPNLAVNLLVSRISPPVADVSYHYSFLPAGLLFVSLIYNLGRLSNLSRWFSVEDWRLRPVVLTATFALLLIALKDLIVYSPVQHIFNASRRSIDDQALRLIPPEASVAAPAKLSTRLSQRPRIYVVEWIADYPPMPLDYVILDTYSRSAETTTAEYQRFVNDVRTSGQYRPLYAAGGLEVYRRQPAGGGETISAHY